MPADQHQHIEEEFLQESWDQMSALLDQEMPTNSKPNPPGKSWLTAILLLLFAWTTYLYWPVQESTNDNPAQKVETTKEDIAASIVDKPLALNESMELVPAVNQNAVAELESKTQNQNKTQVLSPFSISNKAVSSTTFYPKNQNQPTTLTKEVQIIRKVGFDNDLLNDRMDQKEISDLKAINVVASIDNIDLEQITSLIETEKLKPIQFEDHTPKWTVGANYELIFDRRLRSGKYLGLQVKRRLSNQFSLQAGIGLTEYQKLNPAENSFEAFPGMPVRYDYDDDKVSIIGVDAISYISVPMELVFEVRKKWSVIAGLGFSYMLNADFNNIQDDESWQSHEDGSIANSENALMGKALQRFDIAPSIGFSFRPTRRVSLDLKFRNGILDISKDKFLGFNEFHSNRYLHLGMSYDLFKF